MKQQALIAGLAVCVAASLPASAKTALGRATDGRYRVAQAMVPPTGMTGTDAAMPTNERMLKRFPQPVRVGDLIGLPVLDQDSSTLGFVRQVVRTPQGRIQLIVSYSRWWGWFGRLVAVPIEVVGIEGRQIVSLDMDPDDYADASTWHATDGAALPADTTIRIALARD